MLVPCAKHCKIRDVNLRDRTWLRDFSYEDSNGEKVEYKAGDPIGRVLRAWVEALMQFEEAERSKIMRHLEIWGQPRAWTDEKISCVVIELIKEEWGQSLVFCDCLGSQWTEACLLRAWLSNIVWAPYAPEVTSTLQEPDTHEHWQLKSEIRAVKSELHWALETEWFAQVRAARVTPVAKEIKHTRN